MIYSCELVTPTFFLFCFLLDQFGGGYQVFKAVSMAKSNLMNAIACKHLKPLISITIQ